MPKIKNGLIRKRKEELRAETEQESLREKHHIADRNVMIVEKGSVVRSVACIFGSVVRYCALILLVLLAVLVFWRLSIRNHEKPCGRYS